MGGRSRIDIFRTEFYAYAKILRPPLPITAEIRSLQQKVTQMKENSHGRKEEIDKLEIEIEDRTNKELQPLHAQLKANVANRKKMTMQNKDFPPKPTGWDAGAETGMGRGLQNYPI